MVLAGLPAALPAALLGAGGRLLPAIGLLLALTGAARADQARTREALGRLEEVLEVRRADGVLSDEATLPLLIVSTHPRYQSSADWFPTEAASLLIRSFGADGVRLCAACMRLRTESQPGRLVQSSGPISLDEIRALDERYRGDSARAKAAVWIDETASGVAVRLVDLRSARLLFAQNVDPDLLEYRGSARSFSRAAEIERRTRGDSLTHAIFDIALYPGQHVSLEWADQFGDTNANLAGIVISVIDPVLGLGASWYRALEWGNVMVGGKVILSIPTVIAETQLNQDTEIIDPAVTGVFVLRVPFGDSNYAGLATVSTNGVVGLGISLLNSGLIPVLP